MAHLVRLALLASDVPVLSAVGRVVFSVCEELRYGPTEAKPE